MDKNDHKSKLEIDVNFYPFEREKYHDSETGNYTSMLKHSDAERSDAACQKKRPLTA